jgi:hypothetical protein
LVQQSILSKGTSMNIAEEKCECCGKKIRKGKEVWLELSLTDGLYYQDLPEGHESQGCFCFGSTCAAKVTIRKLDPYDN